MMELREVRISKQAEIAPNVFVLSFFKKNKFRSGQVVQITVNKTIPPRVYSIASGESNHEVDILYDVKPEGMLTNQLRKLQKNDKIWVSEPYGNFITGHSKAYWIATGTGIAPFVSMLKSGYGINKTLIHGARHEQHFYYAGLFKNELKTNYIRCCTQCSPGETYQGRLTSYLLEQKQLPTDQLYYLCGVAEMVVEVRDILIAKGIPYQQIVSEIYF